MWAQSQGHVLVDFRGAEIDFELMGGHILRQRVPQDWVLLAATSREIKASLGLGVVQSSLLPHI